MAEREKAEERAKCASLTSEGVTTKSDACIGDSVSDSMSGSIPAPLSGLPLAHRGALPGSHVYTWVSKKR